MEMMASPEAWKRAWMGERMWPKLRALTMTLTRGSTDGEALENGNCSVSGGVVDEDVLVGELGHGGHGCSYALVKLLYVGFFIEAGGDDADGFHPK